MFNISETRRIAANARPAAGILGGCWAIPSGPAIYGPLAGIVGAAAGYFALMDANNKCAKLYCFGAVNFTVAPGGQRHGDFGCR